MSGTEQAHRGVARRLIRLPSVITATGLSRSTIYARVKSGDFPKPVSLGNQLSGWVEGEVQAWIEARINARDGIVVSDDRPKSEAA